MDYAYPADIEPEEPPEAGYVITFPDVPGAVTGGETWEETLSEGADALRVALAGHLKRCGRVPRASAPRPGQVLLPLDPASSAKLALIEALHDRGLRPADLARAMGLKDHKQARRLLDLDHPSRMENLQPALRAMGLQIEVRFTKRPDLPRHAG